MALELWFLLVDGQRFQGNLVSHGYVEFYQERMKDLARIAVDTPWIYESFRKFINDNVFGEGEEEVVDPRTEKQREFKRKFSADIEEEKARHKEKRGPECADSPLAVDEAPRLPASSSTFTMAPDLQPTEPPHPQITAGCAWDSKDWSCPYDTVFMCFWSIYKESPPTWRNNWRLHAPEWNKFFGAAFDSLLEMAQNEQIPQVVLSEEFNAYRETFRNQLTLINSEYFVRHGKVSRSVSRILSCIFGDGIDSQPHLNQVVVCDACNQTTACHCSFTLLGATQLLNKYLNKGDTGSRLPLQEGVTRFIRNALHEPHCTRCPGCSQPVKVQSLSMPEMPWLWIEFNGPISPILPTPHLVFDLPDQRRTYTLQAVIYGGENHFTARLSDKSATWWKYDGMWQPDALRLDHVTCERDLLKNDRRHADCLLYCQTDFHG